MTASAENLYGADDLTHLEGLEAVRKRPGMYIGSTDSRGVNHLFTEIVDNSTDEGVAGHATKIVVRCTPTAVWRSMTTAAASPRERTANPVSAAWARDPAARGREVRRLRYKASGGLHGVGRPPSTRCRCGWT